MGKELTATGRPAREAEHNDQTRRQADIAAMDAVIRNNLEMIQDIAKRLAFFPDVADFLSERLRAISERYSSGQVVMAVMGEFSVGKSTLINALLGERVLTSRVLPTTAILTYIRYGGSPRAVVVTEDGKEVSVDLEALDPYLTGEHKVRSLTLHFPNELLKQGLVIIDTPGSNVENEEHLKRARQAIAEANACLFVFDGKQPFAKSSAKYLDEIRKSITKFAFVMNKADELDEFELDDAVEYARRQIGERMNRPFVEVIPVSAKKALDGDRTSSNFQYLWDTLSDMLKYDKNKIILQDILNLQKNLLVQVNTILEDRARVYEEELRRILGKEVTMEGLRTRATQIIREGVAASIKAAQMGFMQEKNAIIDSVRSTQSRAVAEANSMGALKNAVQSLESYLQETQTKLTSRLSEYIGECYKDNLERLRQFFREAFSDLQAVRDAQRMRNRELSVRIFASIGVGVLAGFINFFAASYPTLMASTFWGTIATLISIVALSFAAAPRDLAKAGLAKLQTRYSIVEKIQLVDIKNAIPTGSNAGLIGRLATKGARIGAVRGDPVAALTGMVIGGLVGAAASWIEGKITWAMRGRELKAEVAAGLAACLRELDNRISALAASQFAVKSQEIYRILEGQIDLAVSFYRYELESIMNRQAELRSRVEARRNTIRQVIADVQTAIERSNSAMAKV